MTAVTSTGTVTGTAGAPGRTDDETGAIDPSGFYTLISGLSVIQRDDRTVQIGSEPPHWLLLRHAPAGAVAILKRLDGTTALADVLGAAGADLQLWTELLTGLLTARLLLPAADWSFTGVAPGPFLESERDSLVHRFGVASARRVLRARQDAVVVVRGSGRLATAVASALAVSGLGHVHQQPDRALRLADLPAADGQDAAERFGAGRRSVRSESAIATPRRGDAALLAANLRRAAPQVKVHAPAAHHRVALVVLAGDGPPAPSLAAELTGRQLPHLAVRAGLTSTVVGPFVLPGRSSCLMCALRQRSELDERRAEFEDGLRQQIVVPPARLVCAAAALVVADVLEHLDGVSQPITVDGTVEWVLGELAPRRRSWSIHPDCGCTDLASELSTT